MRNIQQEITSAINHAYSQQEVETFETNRDTIKIQFLTGMLTLREFKLKARKLEETVSQVFFDTPEALKKGLLFAGLSEDKANLEVEEQLYRNRRLIQFGIPVRFSILFYLTPAKSLAAMISTQVNLTPDIQGETIRQEISQPLAP